MGNQWRFMKLGCDVVTGLGSGREDEQPNSGFIVVDFFSLYVSEDEA